MWHFKLILNQKFRSKPFPDQVSISYHGDLARLKESHFHDTNTLTDEVTERGDRLKVQTLYP